MLHTEFAAQLAIRVCNMTHLDLRDKNKSLSEKSAIHILTLADHPAQPPEITTDSDGQMIKFGCSQCVSCFLRVRARVWSWILWGGAAPHPYCSVQCSSPEKHVAIECVLMSPLNNLVTVPLVSAAPCWTGNCLQVPACLHSVSFFIPLFFLLSNFPSNLLCLCGC